MLAVVDGLGHGQLANEAATRAIAILKTSNNLEPLHLLELVHEALIDTVGVVLGLALVDREQALLTCTGVGNIVIKLVGAKQTQVLLPEGILGYRLLRKACRQLALTPEDVLIMHTDGIRDNYELDPLLLPFPQKMAQALAAGHRNPVDDALVLVATDLLTKGCGRKEPDEGIQTKIQGNTAYLLAKR